MTSKQKIIFGVTCAFLLLPVVVLSFSNERDDQLRHLGALGERMEQLHSQAELKRSEIEEIDKEIKELQKKYLEAQEEFSKLYEELFPPQHLASVKVTSYNPTYAQTDNTPCIAGGTGANVCEMYERGERPLALSQDLLKWATGGEVKAYQQVRMVSSLDDERCNGVFTVVDAMNARYTNRADIFFPEQSMNISCDAELYLL